MRNKAKKKKKGIRCCYHSGRQETAAWYCVCVCFACPIYVLGVLPQRLIWDNALELVTDTLTELSEKQRYKNTNPRAHVPLTILTRSECVYVVCVCLYCIYLCMLEPHLWWAQRMSPKSPCYNAAISNSHLLKYISRYFYPQSCCTWFNQSHLILEVRVHVWATYRKTGPNLSDTEITYQQDNDNGDDLL